MNERSERLITDKIQSQRLNRIYRVAENSLYRAVEHLYYGIIFGKATIRPLCIRI